jgi:hypothetical protein
MRDSGEESIADAIRSYNIRAGDGAPATIDTPAGAHWMRE